MLLKVLMRSLEFHRTGSKTIATEPLLGLSEFDREQTILFYQRGTAIELEDAETGAFLTKLKDGSMPKAASSRNPGRLAHGRGCSSATPAKMAILPT